MIYIFQAMEWLHDICVYCKRYEEWFVTASYFRCISTNWRYAAKRNSFYKFDWLPSLAQIILIRYKTIITIKLRPLEICRVVCSMLFVPSSITCCCPANVPYLLRKVLDSFRFRQIGVTTFVLFKLTLTWKKLSFWAKKVVSLFRFLSLTVCQ